MFKRTLITILALAAVPAWAGSCRYYSSGDHSVQSCSNGYFEVRGRGGVRRYGIRNGGFERYPGQGELFYRTR